MSWRGPEEQDRLNRVPANTAYCTFRGKATVNAQRLQVLFESRNVILSANETPTAQNLVCFICGSRHKPVIQSPSVVYSLVWPVTFASVGFVVVFTAILRKCLFKLAEVLLLVFLSVTNKQLQVHHLLLLDRTRADPGLHVAQKTKTDPNQMVWPTEICGGGGIQILYFSKSTNTTLQKYLIRVEVLQKVSKYNQGNVFEVLKVKVLAAVKCPLWWLYYSIAYVSKCT